MLLPELRNLRVDLVAAGPAPTTPHNTAAERARSIFASQLHKAGIPRHHLTSAEIRTRYLRPVKGSVNGHAATGLLITFEAEAVSDLGRRYSFAIERFVCPHDPTREQRSSPT